MKNSIGILYLCTGPYKLFWEDYYNSFEKKFLRDYKKRYYVFADEFNQGLEKYATVENVTLIHIDAMPWPLITLLRFHYFLTIEDLLKQHDYLMFTNANIVCDDIVTAEEFLPDVQKGQTMSYCQHPGYYGKKAKYNYPYDRNKKSNAYIPYNCGEHYVIGAMFAGKTDAFLRMSHVLNDRIEDDLKHNVIARWHDESQLKIQKGQQVQMQDFTCPAPASGKSSRWCWDAPRINGSMSLACSVGRRTESTSGIPTASRPPSGSLISQRKTVTIRP